MPNELEEKINNIVSEQKITRELLTSELVTKADGTLETPVSFNDGEEGEDRISRVKNPEKVAAELSKIYDKFSDLGFSVKKEKIESLAYFFAVEKPAASEVNLDPLTIQEDQMKIALAFLDIREQRTEQELRGNNFVFSRTIGSISVPELQKFSEEKIAIFCSEIKAGKFNPPQKVEDVFIDLKALEIPYLEEDFEEVLEEVLEAKEVKIPEAPNQNTGSKITAESSIKSAIRSTKPAIG